MKAPRIPAFPPWVLAFSIAGIIFVPTVVHNGFPDIDVPFIGEDEAEAQTLALLDAAAIKTGTLDPARLPMIPREKLPASIASTGGGGGGSPSIEEGAVGTVELEDGAIANADISDDADIDKDKIDSDEAWDGIRLALVSKSADYTVAVTDHYILCTSGASAVTFTLPTPSASLTGFTWIVKKIDSGGGTCVLDPAGAVTIDDAASYTIAAQYESVTVTLDATEYWIV